MKSALVVRKFYAATAGLLLIGGCTVGPNYQRPASALPPAWQEAQQVGLDTQPATLTQWWTEFNDALLDSLVERAVKSNLDLYVAEARIREARARSEEHTSELQSPTNLVC